MAIPRPHPLLLVGALAIAVGFGAIMLLDSDAEPPRLTPAASVDVELPMLPLVDDEETPTLQLADGYRYDRAEDLVVFVKYRQPGTGIAVVSLESGQVVATVGASNSFNAFDARLRPSTGELLVLVGPYEAPRLAIFDFRDPDPPLAVVSLGSRVVGYTIYSPGFHLSIDERVAYYQAHRIDPDCGGSGPQCSEYGVGVVDLEERAYVGEAPLPDSCGVAAFVPEGDSDMLVTCQFRWAFHVDSQAGTSEAEERATPTPTTELGQPTPRPREWRYIDSGTTPILVERADGTRAWLNVRASQDGWVLTRR